MQTFAAGPRIHFGYTAAEERKGLPGRDLADGDPVRLLEGAVSTWWK